MFGFPTMFIVHFIGWPLGWVLLTLLWSYREEKKEVKEDQWLAEQFKAGKL